MLLWHIGRQQTGFDRGVLANMALHPNHFENNRPKSRVLDLKSRRSNMIFRAPIIALAVSLPLLTGCMPQRVLNNGPIITQDQLDLVPVGSSQDQVLLALGTPSTTGQFDDANDVYYYISQKRARRFEFQRLKLVDQKVLSVYFDNNQEVARIANYGIQDGKVFDFITRTTPTTGEDFTFLRQILSGRASPASILQQTRRPAPGAPDF